MKATFKLTICVSSLVGAIMSAQAGEIGPIFALNAWHEPARALANAEARIEVTASVIERLRAGFERQFDKAPDEQELRGLP
jgi:hypothetical protein